MSEAPPQRPTARKALLLASETLVVLAVATFVAAYRTLHLEQVEVGGDALQVW